MMMLWCIMKATSQKNKSHSENKQTGGKRVRENPPRMTTVKWKTNLSGRPTRHLTLRSSHHNVAPVLDDESACVQVVSTVALELEGALLSLQVG